jgi:hypothetical protein
LFAQDVATAERLSCGAFYTPINCDWRGRVYPIPHFNFQRDDRVRALFLFNEGMPMGDDGLWWLKVHVANCGDFDKISKRPKTGGMPLNKLTSHGSGCHAPQSPLTSPAVTSGVAPARNAGRCDFCLAFVRPGHKRHPTLDKTNHRRERYYASTVAA